MRQPNLRLELDDTRSRWRRARLSAVEEKKFSMSSLLAYAIASREEEDEIVDRRHGCFDIEASVIWRDAGGKTNSCTDRVVTDRFVCIGNRRTRTIVFQLSTGSHRN